VAVKKQAYGVLIIHGFASSLDSVRSIEPPLKSMGLPTLMPLLRGHGQTSPEALRGVTWHDWLADAKAALQELLAQADQAILVGHSMGALVGLTIAADGTNGVDSLVLAATPIQLGSPLAAGQPLHFLKPLVIRLLKKWDLPPVYAEPALAKHDTNYHWAPMDAISSFLEFSEFALGRLPQVSVPTLILHSRRDATAAPVGAELVRDGIGTPDGLKRIRWFEITGHEMFQDCESQAAVGSVVEYVRGRVGATGAETTGKN
jgi:carboxylesterase